MIDFSPLKAQVKDKPAAVMGLGASGMAVFRACRAAGIEAVLWDDNAANRDAARAEGANVSDFMKEDMARFAFLCLAPGIPLTHPAPHPAVLAARAAGVEVLGDMELFHRARKNNARVVGITGTNGKSTTTALTGHIMKMAGVDCAVGGNIGTAVLSLPVLSVSGVYVLELSSYQLDLCGAFAPDIAALMNLGPDHLDRHGGMDGYIAAKEKIFRGPGTAIICVDDGYSRAVYERVRAAGERTMVPVSCKTPQPGGVEVTAGGVLLHAGREIADLSGCSALRGAHNWQNAAVACAIAVAAGVPAGDIAKALHTFPGLAHRQMKVTEIDGVSFINDSKATNAEAASMALAAFGNIYWIAGGQSKGAGYAECEAHLGNVRAAFLIGAAEGEMAEWLEPHKIKTLRCGAMDKAVAAAFDAARADGLAGAVVLLSPACASFDQYRNFEHRGDAFTEIAQSLMAGRRTA